MGKTYVVFFNLKLYVNNVFSFFLSFLHIVRFEHFLDSICWYNKQLAYCVRLKLHTCVFFLGLSLVIIRNYKENNETLWKSREREIFSKHPVCCLFLLVVAILRGCSRNMMDHHGPKMIRNGYFQLQYSTRLFIKTVSKMEKKS